VTEPGGGKPRGVDGVVAPGKSSVEEWATRILGDLAGWFSPPPSISRVDHANGTVLVIAVARAPQLIPYVESGEVCYSIRINDSTCNIPPFLISDLVLGRRSHPVSRNRIPSAPSRRSWQRCAAEPAVLRHHPKSRIRQG
jgi:hypothetical protein